MKLKRALLLFAGIAAVVTTVFALASPWESDNPAHAQGAAPTATPAPTHTPTPTPTPTPTRAGGSLQPTITGVQDGANAGEVVVTWRAVSAAQFYRVRWASSADVTATTEAGRHQREAYHYVDLAGAGRTTYTVSRLQPCVAHVFEVAGSASLYGQPDWSGSLLKTPQPAAGLCPDDPRALFPINPVKGDYDHDDDGMIEVRTIGQLSAIRYDLNGDGVADDDKLKAAYAAAFPGAATRMGCPTTGCGGYELANDLDFGAHASATPWVPIGETNKNPFAADFDGNHRTIANLSVNRPGINYAGLFGATGAGSYVQRVGLIDANVIGRWSAGALVGGNAGTVTDSYSTGAVSGAGNVGGLVGSMVGAVTDSHSSATVTGHISERDRIGGLVGGNAGIITRGYATGAVSGDYHVGGLVGWNGGSVTASYATGSAAGTNDVGGLVGKNDPGGAVNTSYATGTATGRDHIGGLVGFNNVGSVTDAYATGVVSARGSNAGGLVGYSYGGSITSSYSTGAASAGKNPGGLLGLSSATVSLSYWNTATSGQSKSAGGEGKTTALLQAPTGTTGIYVGWNEDRWDFGTAKQYPVLKVEGLSVADQR